MTPDQYCANKVAKPGSSFWFSLMTLPDEKRRALIALRALCRELAELAQINSEKDVTLKKLEWWQAEIQRMQAGKAQHPATLALSATLEVSAVANKALGELLEGAEADIEYNAYPEFVQLAVHCHAFGAVPLQLAAHILNAEIKETNSLKDIGTGLRLISIIRHLRDHTRNHRFYFPEDEMQQFDISHQQLQNGEGKRLEDLLAFQSNRARELIVAGFKNLPTQSRRELKNLVALAALNLAVLAQLEQDGFPLYTSHLCLTPLRKFWLARKTLWRSQL